MKSLLFICLMAFGASQGIAQKGAYNAFNVFQSETLNEYIKTLETQTVTQRNKINKSTLVEIFEQGTGKYLGYWGDPEKVEFKDMPYIKSSKGIKKLAKNHTLPVAVAIYQEEVIEGMTTDEVELSWGEANRIEEGEDGASIIRYDDVLVHLVDNAVTETEWFEE